MQQEGDKKGTEVRVINDSNKLEPVGLVSLSPHLDAKTAPRDRSSYLLDMQAAEELNR